MANEEQLARIKGGVQNWNKWRQENQSILIDRHWGAIAQKTGLRDDVLGNFGIEMRHRCRGLQKISQNEGLLPLTFATRKPPKSHKARNFAKLTSFAREQRVREAKNCDEIGSPYAFRASLSRFCVPLLPIALDLSKANLSEAILSKAHLSKANLREANLGGAHLFMANLFGADLSGADLTGVSFAYAQLVDTNLENANLSGCQVYGVSAWNLKLEGAQQKDLIITRDNEPVIVDNLEVAQFIYLLLHNEKIRDVIDTITSKAVLILGRFTSKRKAILDAIREELRHRNYLPIVFDFEKPGSRDLTETISTLAHMARFIIADITDAKSIPQELQAIVPNLPGVPVQPLLQEGAEEYGMFEHFKRYPWVLTVFRYDGMEAIRASVKEKIIAPAEAKAKELLKG